MSVGSKGFLLFVLAAVVVYHLLRGRTAKYGFLLLASWGFYAACSPRYLWVLLLLTAIDYLVGLRIERETDTVRRKRWLVLSVVSNLGLLFAFKYTAFLFDGGSALLNLTGFEVPPRAWEILLPLGISFHTFQGISYTVDIYRRQIRAVRSPLDYALFVAFFPQLAAGPIVRAAEFLPQMVTPPTPTGQQVADGMLLIARGLLKKLLIADQLDQLFVSAVFNDPSAFTPAAQRWAVVAWAVQIYADFSGYSDIAVGTAKLFGFELPVNFRLPYLATSPADFWRRWHRSFSTWLRDYLYFPLGGSRGSEWRTQFNLMVVFVLCGLWHGATGAWLVYGLLSGAMVGLHRLYDKWLTGRPWADRLRRTPGYLMLAWAVTLFQLLPTLVLVRMPDWGTGGVLVRSLVGMPMEAGGNEVPALVPLLVVMGLAGHVFGPLAGRVRWPGLEVVRPVVTAAALGLVLVFAPGVGKTFLYIQF